MDSIKKVKKFMNLFNQPVNVDSSAEVSKQLLQFRFNLMLEELIEFGHAAGIQLSMLESFKQEYDKIDKFCIKKGNTVINHVEMLDAMVDLR
jgi:cell fate (sporulation/competence/biofilm development) regulator YlbF (YheA/YmcA/DUF963 family)